MPHQKPTVNNPTDAPDTGVRGTASRAPRRGYSSPRVVSVESLEAAAVVCAPHNQGGPGKDYPGLTCASHGS